MALMFPRLAHNFIKNGYYPTDEVTLERILNHLAPAEQGKIRIFDPCAGEGVALAECKHHLGADQTSAYAVEYDEARAWHCKELLDVAIHGDYQNCIVSKRSFGLLWLNPPYGDLVRDNAVIGDVEQSGTPRLEKLFYRLSNGVLQFGGVMVLIIPYTCVDRYIAKWIASHFTQVRVYRAPEQQFKQVVVFGIRKRVADKLNGIDDASSKDARQLLEQTGRGVLPPELPNVPEMAPYVVPAAQSADVTVTYGGMDIRQLEHEVGELSGTLWDRFNTEFGQASLPHRRPLRKLSDWHLALTLAAGQISGVVRAKDGRVFVVKGDTHKDKTKKVEYEEHDDGDVSEVRIYTDKFVPVIRALDFTPNSTTFGQALVIR